MIVVISHPTAVVSEAARMNALFEEGLDVLHLRKPTATKDELKFLMEKIEPKYHRQIALHEHHELADEFHTGRLHFNEFNRNKMNESEWLSLKNKGTILSTSIHQASEYGNLSGLFDYTFFGPVFDSISKRGYTSSWTHGFVFPVRPGGPKVIAIGGIDSTTAPMSRSMKFDGVAALGAIWQDPERSIKEFKALRKAWEQTDL